MYQYKDLFTKLALPIHEYAYVSPFIFIFFGQYFIVFSIQVLYVCYIFPYFIFFFEWL